MQSSTDDSSLLMPFVMPKHIVVSTDLTDIDLLLPHAIAQSKVSTAHLTLVHAISPYDSGPTGDMSHQSMKELEARRMLMEVANRIESAGGACSIMIERGTAQDVILRAIQKTGATRLIIGTHGHGHSGQTMLGSVANAVLRIVATPAFVVGPHALLLPVNPAPRKILHSVSLKGDYRQHASLALEVAKSYNAELTLLHVLPYYLSKSQYVEKLSAKAKNALDELIPPNTDPKLSIRTIVTCGELVDEIVKTSIAARHDWIVLGIEHDFPFWSKSNNAAYQVLAASNCPVLTLRGHLHAPADPSAMDLRYESASNHLQASDL